MFEKDAISFFRAGNKNVLLSGGRDARPSHFPGCLVISFVFMGFTCARPGGYLSHAPFSPVTDWLCYSDFFLIFACSLPSLA